MGALFHLSEGIGYLGSEEHVTRIRHWSATQPDHLKIALHPVEELPFTRDWATPYAVELVQPGCSKGNRLAQWAASEEIAMEQVVAFGDNNNDISMFEQVGLAGPHRSKAMPTGSPPTTTKMVSHWRYNAGYCPDLTRCNMASTRAGHEERD